MFKLYFWKHCEGYVPNELLPFILEFKANIYSKGQPCLFFKILWLIFFEVAILVKLFV
jgi:hypothetical protein